jgi:hypothetical protein
MDASHVNGVDKFYSGSLAAFTCQTIIILKINNICINYHAGFANLQ